MTIPKNIARIQTHQDFPPLTPLYSIFLYTEPSFSLFSLWVSHFHFQKFDFGNFHVINVPYVSSLLVY